MMLVYNLPNTGAIYERFGGIDGSAYFIGGFGMTALTANNIVLVPIRSGVGLRLGANIGYLKFTPKATWNPALEVAELAVIGSDDPPAFTLNAGNSGSRAAPRGMVAFRHHSGSEAPVHDRADHVLWHWLFGREPVRARARFRSCTIARCG